MPNAHSSFSVFQVQLRGRHESDVTDTALGKLFAAVSCSQSRSWAEWSGSRVRFYGTSSVLIMAESATREAGVLRIEEEPQSREML